MKIPKKIIRPWQTRQESPLERPWVTDNSRGQDAFYQSKEWRKCRKIFIADNPLCVECRKKGRVREANVVDHIVPRKDGGSDFDNSNLQPMCAKCHAAKSAKEKRRYGRT